MEPSFEMAYLAAGFGSGIIAIGAALGIGIIGKSAMEGTARQPQAANDIRTSIDRKSVV